MGQPRELKHSQITWPQRQGVGLAMVGLGDELVLVKSENLIANIPQTNSPGLSGVAAGPQNDVWDIVVVQYIFVE